MWSSRSISIWWLIRVRCRGLETRGLAEILLMTRKKVPFMLWVGYGLAGGHSKFDYAYGILVGKTIKLKVVRHLSLVWPLFFFFKPILGLYFLVCKVRGKTFFTILCVKIKTKQEQNKKTENPNLQTSDSFIHIKPILNKYPVGAFNYTLGLGARPWLWTSHHK